MKPAARLANIDALRAVAALLVIVAHTIELVFGNLPAPSALDRSLHSLWKHVDLGRIGVMAFFCISGYLIPGTIHGARISGAAAFLIKRVVRIYPAFWVSVVAIALVLSLAAAAPPSLNAILMTATMIPQALGHTAIMGHYWTLELELAFYLACAALFMLGLTRSPMVFFSISCGLILAGTMPGRVMAFLVSFIAPGAANPLEAPNTRVLLVCLGVMFWAASYRGLADGLAQGWRSRALILGAGATYCIAVPVLGILLHLVGSDTQRAATTIANGAGVLLFVCTLLVHRKLGWLSALGTVSYSLYLLHPVALYLLPPVLKAFPSVMTTPFSVLISIVFVGALSCVLATASYLAIERPSIQAGRWLATRVQRRQPRETAEPPPRPIGDTPAA